MDILYCTLQMSGGFFFILIPCKSKNKVGNVLENLDFHEDELFQRRGEEIPRGMASWENVALRED